MHTPQDGAQNDPHMQSRSCLHSRSQNPRMLQIEPPQSLLYVHSVARVVPMHATISTRSIETPSITACREMDFLGIVTFTLVSSRASWLHHPKG
jgi:hypothetical protein